MKYGLILSLVIALPCMGQTKVTGDAKIGAPCSAAASGDKNIFVINCGIGKAQAQKMVEILNKILAGQTDPTKEIEVQRAIDELRGIHSIVEVLRKNVQLICKSSSPPELQKECEQNSVAFHVSMVEPGKTTDSLRVQKNPAPKK